MKYFAYGSNMLHARLARRVPSAEPVGVARLPRHTLRFHKRGGDGSGKCNAFRTGRDEDVVYGVVYEVDGDRLERLHQAEGPGYEFVNVNVEMNGEVVEAVTYRARHAWIEDALAPYSWYQSFVVAGAREHGLPRDYVVSIENVFARRDPNIWRRLRNRWIRKTPPVRKSA